MTQFPEDLAIERAWSRINRSDWDRMNWFVRLANVGQFDAMPEKERQALQEEMVAMLMNTPLSFPIPADPKRFPTSPASPRATFADWQKLGIVPTAQQMQQCQGAIKVHIAALADGKGTDFGPFDFTYTAKYIYNPRHKRDRTLPRYFIQIGEIAGGRDPFQRALLFQMEKLLRAGYVDKIRRCKLDSCPRLFLQLRRNANYCGPDCYTVGCMREFRENGPKRRRAKKDSRATTSAKGGPGHGKKRR